MKKIVHLTFIKNEVKGTVTCIATNCKTELMKDLNMDLNVPANYVPELLLSDTYVGVARVKGEDVFDEGIGAKIAYEIVTKKIKEAKLRKVQALVRASENFLDGIKNLEKKYLTKR